MSSFTPTIDRGRLARIIGRESVSSTPTSGGAYGSYQHKSYDKDPRSVSAEVLAETGEKHPECQCDKFGLAAGITMPELRDLGAGCTDGRNPGGHGRFVCPRLDKVRRRYGK